MDAYCIEVHKLKRYFHGLEFHHVMRDLNVATNVLAKLRLEWAHVPGMVFVQELIKPPIKDQVTEEIDTPMPDRQLMIVTLDWIKVFIDYILHHKLIKHKVQIEQVTRRSNNYVLVGDKLYRWGASSGVLMKCIIA